MKLDNFRTAAAPPESYECISGEDNPLTAPDIHGFLMPTILKRPRKAFCRLPTGTRSILAICGSPIPSLFVLLWFLAFAVLGASEPNYFVRLWQTDDGLPQNAVTAIVQSPDGYLWLGTYSGLARFDGVQFVTFDNNNVPQMRSSRVTSLFVDASGALWIGHETGQVTRHEHGKFEATKTVPAWNGQRIAGISSDSAGDIWLLNGDGLLARMRDGTVLSPPSGPQTSEVSLHRDPRGKLWVFRNGAISFLDHGRITPLRLPTESDGTNSQGIGVSLDGGLWVAANGRLREWRDDQWVKDLGAAPWGSEAAVTLKELHDGSVAGGTIEQGLTIISRDGHIRSFNHTNGLASDWVRALCQDREGDLWVGTGSGLAALRNGDVVTVNAPDYWQNRTVLSVTTGRDDSLWVGTEGAGLYRLKNGRWDRFGVGDGISNLFVWSVLGDDQGKLWAGTWGGGLYVQNGDRFKRPAGLEDITTAMTALLRADDGGLWIGTGTGLLHYRAGKATWYGTKQGLMFPDVRTIARGADGTIWFGMFGGGLGRLKSGSLRQFRKSDGLSSDFIQCLRMDENGALWIGTFGGGLDRLKNGKFAVVGEAQGLPNRVICDIQDDQNGNYWFSSHGGIFRASKQELNRCADGQLDEPHWERFTKGDGMPTLECTGGFQPAACRTPDGRLWFPTSKGLAVVNPAHVRRNPLPPPVVIQKLLVDNYPVAIPAKGNTPVRIPPGHHRVEIHYTGLSFVAPEKVQFKYRLEGLEQDWMDAGTKRLVNYSFIPPGNYTFHVTACNNDQVWNQTGATLSFDLLPYFWQTLWFHFWAAVLTVAAASGAVWFDVRRRMRRKLERMERERAIERERERIAKDIHDDLGASLTRITMLSQSARGDLDVRRRRRRASTAFTQQRAN